MAIEFSSEQIIAGLVGLGLLVKGILEISAKKKMQTDSPARGCLYGDAAHDELKRMISDLNTSLTKVLTILEERKHG
jgi:hypothetical protein